MSKKRAVSATLWSAAEIVLRQGVQFVVAIFLARLITPEEFGIVALLYLFMGLGLTFADGGFSSALIQRQDITHVDESTVFWFNILIALVVALILWSLAPAIAQFYDVKVLEPLTRIMSLNIPLGALGSIHQTVLTKRLEFSTLLQVGAISVLFSGSVAVVLAWQGYGVWALAAHILATTAATSTLLWIFSGWRPGIIFSSHSVRRLFGFGSYMLASAILEITYSRLYTLLIGKFYSLVELGFYERAANTKQAPANMLGAVIGRVALPLFSERAHDKQRLTGGVSRALRGAMLINVPMMLGLAVVAEPLIVTLFGKQWLSAVPILQVLCLAGVFWPLHVINLNALLAQGHSQLFFRLEVIKKVLGIAIITVASFSGVMAIAWSQVIFAALAFLINAHYSKVYLNYSAIEQIGDFLPVMLIAAIMSVVVYGAGLMIGDGLAMPSLLALQAGVGILVFLLLGFVFRLKSINEATIMLMAINKTD